jgi:hypothetical protein
LYSLFKSERYFVVEMHTPSQIWSITSMDNDLILLKLHKPVSAPTKPVCLLEYTRRLLFNHTLYALGWGSPRSVFKYNPDEPWFNSNPSPLLKRVEMVDQTDEDPKCDNKFSLICANGVKRGSGPCRGDSGGPLITQINGKFNCCATFRLKVQKLTKTVDCLSISGRGYLVGTLSSGNVKNEKKVSKACLGDGKYTRTASYLSWIKKTVNEPLCIADYSDILEKLRKKNSRHIYLDDDSH